MGSGTHATGAPTPALVFETLTAYQRTAALRAAIELGLFHALGEGPGDVTSLARACSASERGIRILCDYLTVIGLVAKQDGRYSHTPTSALFLDPRSPNCVASTAKFLGNPDIVQPALNLADIVRDGRTTLSGDGTLEPENPV
ncbi:MAG: methyltransferase dimerization domain-containing protein [Bryobacteraceae bacterium]